LKVFLKAGDARHRERERIKETMFFKLWQNFGIRFRFLSNKRKKSLRCAELRLFSPTHNWKDGQVIRKDFSF